MTSSDLHQKLIERTYSDLHGRAPRRWELEYWLEHMSGGGRISELRAELARASK
jgi:hypothetical protein